MGLYLALEVRSQQRVIKEGMSVTSSHRDMLVHEAKNLEHRLALVAQSEASYSYS